LPLRPLGSVLHITKSKYIVVKLVKADDLPPLGAEVVDANNEVVGRLVDIIGPVTQPYAIVRPLKPSVVSFIKPSMFLFYRILKIKKGTTKRGRS
jgi:RNA-binding protein